MFRVKQKNIYLNRGDAIALRLVNNEEEFRVGDKIKFSICEQNDYTKVIFSKEFIIDTQSNFTEVALTSEETSLGEPIKDGSVTYWYEIELNGDTTLVGYDENGAKKFILYPEAGKGGQG